MTTTLSFEQAMKRLEEIVTELEQGKVSLDQSLKLFEEGNELIKSCDLQLKKVEMKAAKILEGNQITEFKSEE